jgi:type VI secretion system secreted protein VgrG
LTCKARRLTSSSRRRNRIVLNGGGGYVKIEGGNIEIGTGGKASFKAAMKELTGGASASDNVTLKKVGEIKGCAQQAKSAAGAGGVFI